MADEQAPNIPPGIPPPPAHPPVPEMPEPPASGHGLSAQAVELLRFVRDENQANRAYFTFLVRLFGGGITFLLLVAGGLLAFSGFRTFHDIQSQAQFATAAEITRMQTEIRSELQKQFSEPVMQTTIKDAAGIAVKTAVTSQVSAQLSSLRAEADTTRSDVDKYAMPRVVTQQQQAELKSYFSIHKPFGFIFMRYAVNDPEAAAYAEQLAGAFRAGGWQAGAAGDFTERLTPGGGLFPGIGIWIESPKDYSPTSTQNENQLTLARALGAAHLPAYGSGSIGPAYQLYIYVGPRPLELSGAPAKR